MQWDDPEAYHEKSWVVPVYGDTDSLYLSYNQLLKTIKGYENMTIEQIWEYGKKRGSEFYSPYISDVDYCGNNNDNIVSVTE